MPLKPRSGLEPGDVAHPIELLGLSPRPYNALRRGGVRSIEVLLQMSESEICGIRGVGGICYGEIRQALQRWQQSLPGQQTAPPTRQAGIDVKQEEQSLCAAWSLPPGLRKDQTGIAKLGLKPHAERELVAVGVSTVSQLVALSVSELRGVRWFGFSTVDDIRRRLSKYSLRHAAAPPPRPDHGSECPSLGDKPQVISPVKLSSQELVDDWVRRLRNTQRQAIIDERDILADEGEAPRDADAIDGLTATAEASTDQDSAPRPPEHRPAPPVPARRPANPTSEEKSLPATREREPSEQPGQGAPSVATSKPAAPTRSVPLLVAWSLPGSLAHDEGRIAALDVGFACDLRLAGHYITTVRQLCSLTADDLARIAELDEAGLQRIRLKLIDRALLNSGGTHESNRPASSHVSKMARESRGPQTPTRTTGGQGEDDALPAPTHERAQHKQTRLGRWTESFRARRTANNTQRDQCRPGPEADPGTESRS